MIVNPVIYSGKELPELENPGTAADLLAGKQLVDQYGNPLTGTMPEVSQAIPSISVSSNGLITASATQDAGHVTAGTKSKTYQLTTQGAQTITPKTYDQSIASGRYLTGQQTIKGDTNLVSENIKSGVSIFGVAGSYSGEQIKRMSITQDMISYDASNGFKISHGINGRNIISIALFLLFDNNGLFQLYLGAPGSTSHNTYNDRSSFQALFSILNGSGGEATCDNYIAGYSIIRAPIPYPGYAVSTKSLSGCICYG